MADSVAVVVGASGAIGGAIAGQLAEARRYEKVIVFARSGTPAIDLTEETSVAEAAQLTAAAGLRVGLVFDATGFLHGEGFEPEKTFKRLDPDHMIHAYRVNAIGPALLMKHFLPLLPRDGRSVFATISAKVGSIGDNALGGWHSYRASKAALNQLVRTAAIELKRTHPQAICVALHPGTVDSGLSAPFGKTGLDVRSPDVAAGDLLAVVDKLVPAQSGGFLDYHGERLPW